MARNSLKKKRKKTLDLIFNLSFEKEKKVLDIANVYKKTAF